MPLPPWTISTAVNPFPGFGAEERKLPAVIANPTCAWIDKRAWIDIQRSQTAVGGAKSF